MSGTIPAHQNKSYHKTFPGGGMSAYGSALDISPAIFILAKKLVLFHSQIASVSNRYFISDEIFF